MKNTRDFVAFAVIALFAFLLVRDPTDKLIQGAMIAAFSTAYGFYLGGSKIGSDTAARNAEIVGAAATSTPTEPQPVTVVNDEAQPVPVEAK